MLTPDVIYAIYTLTNSMDIKFDTFQKDCNMFASDNDVVCGPGPIIQRDDWTVGKRKMEGKLTMLQVYVADPSVR